MAKRIFEHMCPAGHITEHYVGYETKVVPCGVCGTDADRIISTPQIMLDGTDPVYVSAHEKWAKMHEQGAALERKRNEA